MTGVAWNDLTALPIPRHLVDLAQVVGRIANAPGLTLKLRSRGGSAFEIAYTTFGEGGPLEPEYPGALSVVQGTLATSIFDLSLHGYDAVAAGFHPDGPRITHRWRCEACDHERAEVTVSLMYNNWDDADFQEMTEPLEDCFDWITIDLACAACGSNSAGFLECECA